MSQIDNDAIDDDADDPQAGQQVSLSRKDIRALEKKGKGFDDEKQRADKLEREMVFVKAGIDTDSDPGRLFARGYDGELTKEAVAAAAAPFGLVKSESEGKEPQGQQQGQQTQTPPAQPDGPELQPGEADLTRERQDISSQAPRDEGINPDPYESAIDLGRKVIDGGGKIEEGIGTAINMLATKAHEGDRRVIIDRRSTAGRDV